MLSEKRNKDGQKRSLTLELLPWAMESQPVKAVKAGLLIGGVDPVAVDTVSTTMMEVDPAVPASIRCARTSISPIESEIKNDP